MKNIIKRENGSQPAAFGSVVDQIFQNNLNRFFDDEFWGFNGSISRNSVPVNIRETDSNYELEIIAPGLKKQDFQLNLSGENLTISFDQKEEHKEQSKNAWLKQEYRKQAFTRSFTLNEYVDINKISARYEDGVLLVELPKKEVAQKVSRAINVQ
jgi:HSP20 family protein